MWRESLSDFRNDLGQVGPYLRKLPHQELGAWDQFGIHLDWPPDMEINLRGWFDRVGKNWLASPQRERERAAYALAQAAYSHPDIMESAFNDARRDMSNQMSYWAESRSDRGFRLFMRRHVRNYKAAIKIIPYLEIACAERLKSPPDIPTDPWVRLADHDQWGDVLG